MILQDLIGDALEEEFQKFNLSEIEPVLKTLKEINAIDIAHAELFQLQALRAADIIAEYLGKLVKTVSYLESRISTVKNKVALDFTPKDGGKASIELRKMAGDAAPEIEQLGINLAKAKGAKVALEKKYDILIRAHHYYKDIASGLRRSMVGQQGFGV